jgi:hypothetical protein
MPLQTNDIVVDALYENATKEAEKFIETLNLDHKPLIPKYRLELKFLLEDKEDDRNSNS